MEAAEREEARQGKGRKQDYASLQSLRLCKELIAGFIALSGFVMSRSDTTEGGRREGRDGEEGEGVRGESEEGIEA